MRQLVRARICEGLSFLGIELDESRNAETAGVISTDASRVTVRVIRTDEELMIARSVWPRTWTRHGSVKNENCRPCDEIHLSAGSVFGGTVRPISPRGGIYPTGKPPPAGQ